MFIFLPFSEFYFTGAHNYIQHVKNETEHKSYNKDKINTKMFEVNCSPFNTESVEKKKKGRKLITETSHQQFWGIYEILTHSK